MIVNRQNQLRPPVKELEAFLGRVQTTLGLTRHEITVCLLSDVEIARLNRTFRRKPGPTDVLSFPVNGVRRKRNQGRKSLSSTSFTSSTSLYLGDIAIAPGVARRNARSNRRLFRHELRVLILHGVLHLLGYDHETDHGEMDRLEHRLRRRLKLE